MTSKLPVPQIFDKQIEPTDAEFAALQKVLRDSSGIALGKDKRYLIAQRLSPLLKEANCDNYNAFLGKLGYDPVGSALRERLIEAMTTNETSFFRDQHPFEAFRDNILPAMAARLRANRLKPGGMSSKIRLWCAASSSGQEPYSFAMLLKECLGTGSLKDVQPEDFHIVATDIDSAMLARAKKGVYSEVEVERGLPHALRLKYFSKTGQDWTLAPSVKKLVEFKQMNLIMPFGWTEPFDLISCRNVLIYFEDKMKARLLERFHNLLVPGGALLLGAMESTYCLFDKFHSKRVGKTTVYERL